MLHQSVGTRSSFSPLFVLTPACCSSSTLSQWQMDHSCHSLLSDHCTLSACNHYTYMTVQVLGSSYVQESICCRKFTTVTPPPQKEGGRQRAREKEKKKATASRPALEFSRTVTHSTVPITVGCTK